MVEAAVRIKFYSSATPHALPDFGQSSSTIPFFGYGNSACVSILTKTQTKHFFSGVISQRRRARKCSVYVVSAQWGEGVLPERGGTSRHPFDPHLPISKSILPDSLRPYPSFEGWFIRIVDPISKDSFGVILATNNATRESQTTVISSTAIEPSHYSHLESTNSVSNDSKSLMRRPKVVAEITKGAYWKLLKEHDSKAMGQASNSDLRIPGFQWEAKHLGFIKVDQKGTFIDVSIKGISLQANLTNQSFSELSFSQMEYPTHWDAENSFMGPEGWAHSIELLPTHWFVHSLSSSASYQFIDSRYKHALRGKGFAHEEKNWGQGFPSGHVWAQGFPENNSAQLVVSGAIFKLGQATSPYVFAGTFRSKAINLDFRSNDLTTFFSQEEIDAKMGTFHLLVTTPKHVIKIHAKASPSSFSEPILAPTSKLEWSPACRESYSAKIRVDVFETGILGSHASKTLISSTTFPFAALEFGEDLA